MKRKEFITRSASLLGSAAVPKVFAARLEEASELRSKVRDYYHVYYAELDHVRYRALLTDDYLLLEHGEVLDAAKDISLMPKPEDEYRRTDAFDFRQIKVEGDTAYAVYFLKSEILTRNKSAVTRQRLETIAVPRLREIQAVIARHMG